jgi:serine/threonine protein kinase
MPVVNPALREPFGKYLLQREMGRGGMAVVYEAVDSSLGRRVAIKILHRKPDLPAHDLAVAEERFLREARLAAAIPKHPNIVGVHDAGVHDGRQYIAMEIIDGRPLSVWTEAESASLARRVAVLRDVALAAHHAHEHGVIHRDLKPQNILVDAAGRPHVADFGLAKLDAGSSVSLTAEGMTVGTPGYISPEQAQGFKTVDRRTDVFALGIMLYEMLTGKTPFQGESAVAILTQVIRDPITPPSRVLRTPPDPTLERICLKAVAKNPEERYLTAQALAEDLSLWLEGDRVKVAHPRKRAPWLWLAGLGGVAAAVAAVLLRPAPPPAPPSPPPVVPAAAVLPLRPSVVRVPSDQEWTNTGLDVREGETLEAGCEGTWTNNARNQPFVTAAGRPPQPGQGAKFPVPEGHVMALVARVGKDGKPWLVPPGTPVKIPASGRLYLGPNDSGVKDNGGELSVTLRVGP